MEFWKALIISKEIKKPSDKFLRVWAKNQLRFEIFEKILKFTWKNLNGKLIFYPFSLPFSWTFVILYTSGTYQKFLGWLGGSFAGLGGGTFEFGGRGGCINPWNVSISASQPTIWDPMKASIKMNTRRVLIAFKNVFQISQNAMESVNHMPHSKVNSPEPSHRTNFLQRFILLSSRQGFGEIWAVANRIAYTCSGTNRRGL